MMCVKTKPRLPDFLTTSMKTEDMSVTNGVLNVKTLTKLVQSYVSVPPCNFLLNRWFVRCALNSDGFIGSSSILISPFGLGYDADKAVFGVCVQLALTSSKLHNNEPRKTLKAADKARSYAHRMCQPYKELSNILECVRLIIKSVSLVSMIRRRAVWCPYKKLPPYNQWFQDNIAKHHSELILCQFCWG